MGSETWHEQYDSLPPETRDLHRAIVSLMEELEAVDWYQQRASVTPDGELKAVLEHNRDEEIEHAMMTLEWIRRRVPKFDEHMRTYLFTDGPITEVEATATGKSEGGGGAGGATEGGPPRKGGASPPAKATAEGSLGIGSLNPLSGE